MRKLLMPLFCTIMAISLQANAQTAAPKDGPQFKFEGGDTHDFGVVKRGPVAMHVFEFVNTGNRPLNIMDVKPSCGCTNVEWPKVPIMPGQKGKIQLGLKTEEQHGVFNKEVYIQSDAVNNANGGKRYVLYIKGNAVDEVKK